MSLVAMESTNPVLQLRWFLRETGYKNSPITTAVDVVFITMFFVMRMLIGTYMLFSVVKHPRPAITIKMGGTVFIVISYIFMFMIFRYAYRKYVLRGKRPRPVSNGVNNNNSAKHSSSSIMRPVEAAEN